jgi:dihydroorotase
MAELADLGVRLFVDDGVGVQDARVMRRALEYAAGLGVVIAQHAEEASLAAGGQLHEGEWAARLGIGGIPAAAEELIVMRDLALARLTGAALHFQHLSTAGSLAMVGAARRGGLPVTLEATVHHALLTDADCATFDADTKFRPPLRPEGDRSAVLAGLGSGLVDALVSDHTPVAVADKEVPFDEAAPGAVGLEWTLALALGELGLDLDTVVGLLSWRPAAIAGLLAHHGGPIEPGRVANLCVIDPAAVWSLEPAAGASRSRNTPFAGRALRGRARHTVLRGEPVVIEFEAQR